MKKPITIAAAHKLVEKYHRELGYTYQYEKVSDQRDEANQIFLAMFQEVGELVDSTPWKPWRDVMAQGFDRDNLCTELVDIFFFVSHILSIYGITDEELRDAFNAKLEICYNRLKSGYSTKMHSEE